MVNIPKHELVGVNELRLDPYNIKIPDKQKLSALVHSIKKFGFVLPVITNKTLLIADGHQRLEAARELNMEQVPVIRLDVDEVDRKLLRQVITKLQWDIDEEKDYFEINELIKANKLQELSMLIATPEHTLVSSFEYFDFDNLLDKTPFKKQVKTPHWVVLRFDEDVTEEVDKAIFPLIKWVRVEKSYE